MKKIMILLIGLVLTENALSMDSLWNHGSGCDHYLSDEYGCTTPEEVEQNKQKCLQCEREAVEKRAAEVALFQAVGHLYNSKRIKKGTIHNKAFSMEEMSGVSCGMCSGGFYETTVITQFPCTHTFCEYCISWNDLRISCPVCKINLLEEDLK